MMHHDSRRNDRLTARPSRLALGSLIAVIAMSSLGTASCSSAPKRPPEVFTNRNAAAGQIDLANRSVARADFTNAKLFLVEAWNLAVSTDDPETRVRVLLARGNAHYNEGSHDNAIADWNQALTEATDAGNTTLASAARIYVARSDLIEGSGKADPGEAERKAIATRTLETVRREIGKIKGNPLYTAFGWKVEGLCLKELGEWKAAESAVKKAVDIHDGSHYLEDAAYDWYIIASIRSKAGQYDSGRAAMQKALSFDRRAENTNGLGLDWIALGMIEEKAGNLDKALAAYRRSSDIFRSAFIEDNAKLADAKAAAIAGPAAY